MEIFHMRILSLIKVSFFILKLPGNQRLKEIIKAKIHINSDPYEQVLLLIIRYKSSNSNAKYKELVP